VDPFGGERDLQAHILRAVGDPEQRFREDALRILRGARFAARFRLVPEQATLEAMEKLTPLLGELARERVYEELCKLILRATAQDLLRFGPVIAGAIPELAVQIGLDQRSPHHAYDLYTHTCHVVEAVPEDLTLRWVALLHDVGKPACFTQDPDGRGHFKGHAKVSQEIADNVLLRLKAPSALRQQVTELIGLHMTKLEPEKKVLRRWLSRLGVPMLQQLLALQQADMRSKGTDITAEFQIFERIHALLAEINAENACLSLKDLAVNGNDLIALGYTGKAIGITLNRLLELVLDEQLPNRKEDLLNFIQENKETNL
jgi:tRNA nucleotidyltransferase (CCA-adding enzyme)